MMATLCPLFAGATTVMMSKFDVEEVLRRLPDSTAMMAVPTIWGRLADHPGFNRETARTLRLATSGSAPLSPTLYDRLKDEAGVVLLDRYGSTEAGMVAANPVGRSKRASVGQVLGGVEVRIADASGLPAEPGEAGRVQVKGANVFFGYWNRPELDAQTWTVDGYFDTGDFGILDEEGYLTIVGRDKDMIISGGFNVYPREIEIALEEIDGVAEAAAFGVPHPDFGEGVVAAVIAEPGVQLDPASLATELAGRLTAYKRPKVIRIVDEFPRNPMGKLLRKELSEEFVNVFTLAS
jgi:malonyl-CoA/methylmalonyl-CoA synthetase